MTTLPVKLNPLRRSLDLCQRFSDLETCLLSQSHDLEALEVGESTSSLLLGALLCPCALLPLCLDSSLLPCSLDGSSAGASWERLKDNRCEDELGESDRLTWDSGLGVGGWAIDQSLMRALVPNFPSSFDVFLN
jgi:hypothetical protein